MKSVRLMCLFVLLGLLLGGGAEGRASSAPSQSLQPAAPSLLRLPLRFEPNRGQMDERVRFLARGHGYELYLTTEGATVALKRSSNETRVVSMRMVGGRLDIEPAGSQSLPGTTNYFIGDDPSRWRTGVEGYARVRYAGVLPGVDVVYYADAERRLEYDLILAPGADPKGIAIAFDGAQSLTIDRNGAAVLELEADAEIVLPAPVAYQTGPDGKREPVAARYERRDGALAFVVGRFDRARALVIDPTLVYSTYLGGSSDDAAYGITVDSAGEAFVVGSTSSTNFPGASNASTGENAFVTKLNASGSALVYSTYLGGSSDDAAYGIALDAAGQAYVTGLTRSTDFPTTSAFQSTNKAGANGTAFVTKLNASGFALLYSTYLGGSAGGNAAAIAVDSGGEAFVAGSTESIDFPTVSPAQATFGGGVDACVTKLQASGSALVYSTYLGGSGFDLATGVAIDPSGEAFVAGVTQSSDFPTASPFQSASKTGGDDTAFVTKLSPSGSALVYSTYLGGSAYDYASAIAVDPWGQAYVTGFTASTDFPLAAPYQGTNAGHMDAFITKLNTAGSALLYSTYLGGSSYDYATAIAIDSNAQPCVAGYTQSANFPTASPYQAALGAPGAENAFVTTLNTFTATLVRSTYLGGSANDYASAIAVGPALEVFVAGYTSSTNFPTASAYQGNAGGGYDAFVTRFPALPVIAYVPAMGGHLVWLAALLLIAGGGLAASRHRRREGAVHAR